MRAFDLPLSDTAQAYCDKLLSLESMTPWEEQAIGKMWRAPDHEQEIILAGEVLADFRAK